MGLSLQRLILQRLPDQVAYYLLQSCRISSINGTFVFGFRGRRRLVSILKYLLVLK